MCEDGGREIIGTAHAKTSIKYNKIMRLEYCSTNTFLVLIFLLFSEVQWTIVLSCVVVFSLRYDFLRCTFLLPFGSRFVYVLVCSASSSKVN